MKKVQSSGKRRGKTLDHTQGPFFRKIWKVQFDNSMLSNSKHGLANIFRKIYATKPYDTQAQNLPGTIVASGSIYCNLKPCKAGILTN
jgi:hypothetical protein